MSQTYSVRVKFGTETYDKFPITPTDGPSKLLEALSDKTGVPKTRLKVMCARIWKGVLKDDMPDWDETIAKGKWKNNLQVRCVGTAEVAKAPEKQTVFMEDMTTKDKQKLEAIAPPGLENLGNTCYMNATLQCLKAVPELRKSLETVRGGATPGQAMTSELGKLYDSMDGAKESVTPSNFVRLMRQTFPNLNTFNARQGGFSQEDADEFFNTLVQEMRGHLTKKVEDVEFGSKTNAIDALFSMDVRTTHQCTESDEIDTISDNFTRLQCVIDGTINSMEDGLKLGLNGSLDKNSAKLGRNAVWKTETRLHQVPLYLTVQFNRFYWKTTDDGGVPCKIMRPVRFPMEFDVYEFCDKDLQAVLDPARKRYTEKLLAQGNGEKMEEDEELDPELKAAMDMSLNPGGATAGIGVPPSFRGIYELFGVVTHKGRNSKSGHYLGWVKQKDGKWMCFDDEFGSYCEEEDIKRLAGDGADWHIAYMTFYRVKE